MDSNPSETALRVFCDVIEQMAFMFSDEAEVDSIPGPASEAFCAHMSFSGPCTGALRLAVPAEMCPVLAENILGIDADDEGVMEKAQDALKEVLNVSCGNVLPALMGEEPVFDLTVPEITSLGQDGWKALCTEPGTVAALVDDFPVLLHLSIGGRGE